MIAVVLRMPRIPKDDDLQECTSQVHLTFSLMLAVVDLSRFVARRKSRLGEPTTSSLARFRKATSSTYYFSDLLAVVGKLCVILE